jgi:GT2 family glycosyltransferase
VPDNNSETISVVVPTYNGIRYIADCLDSLRKQLRKPDEVILVDDGSTDGTLSVVEKSYPEVRCIRLESNRGFAAAVNEGIRHSNGTYIALLNNDTRADEAWLRELENTLAEQLSVGFCASKMLFADRPDIINSIGIGFTQAGMAADIGYGQKDGDRFRHSRPVFGACAGAAMYRKAMLNDIGLFDEDFFMWYEDVDLSFRAQLAGYKCVYVPTAVIYHVGGGTASADNNLHLHYCSRNQVLVMVKNLPDPLRFRYFRRMAIICAKHSMKMMLRGKTAVMAGYLAALKDLRYFIKKHKATSETARISSDEIERLLLLDSAEMTENR